MVFHVALIDLHERDILFSDLLDFLDFPVFGHKFHKLFD